MPLYEYKCDHCGDVFEVIQKFSDAPIEQHEGCGGRVERLLSAPALQFKGTGWYVTDYARNAGNGKPAAKADSSSEGKDKPAAAEKKSETSKPSSTGTETKK